MSLHAGFDFGIFGLHALSKFPNSNLFFAHAPTNARHKVWPMARTQSSLRCRQFSGRHS